jgi:RNA polymerase sigma-70 factor, ECF subfamily
MSGPPRTLSTDEELMAALAGGEELALRDLYLRHGGFVSQVIGRTAPEIGSAQLEELRQDVFWNIFRTAGRYEERGKLRAWIYGIAARTARHWRQRAWLRRRLLKENESESLAMAWKQETSPESAVSTREQIHATLAALPDGQQEVLVLHAEGFSGEEIAGMLDIRPKTVWTRLHRARRSMLKSSSGTRTFRRTT